MAGCRHRPPLGQPARNSFYYENNAILTRAAAPLIAERLSRNAISRIAARHQYGEERRIAEQNGSTFINAPSFSFGREKTDFYSIVLKFVLKIAGLLLRELFSKKKKKKMLRMENDAIIWTIIRWTCIIKWRNAAAVEKFSVRGRETERHRAAMIGIRASLREENVR